MRWPLAATASCLALAAPADAQAAPLSPANLAAITIAAERGRLLYAYDQAAWHATDDMVAKLPDYATRVRGWIIDGPAAAPTVVFFDRDRANPHAVYIAHFGGGALVSGTVLGTGDDRALSPYRLRLIAARDKALAAFGAAKVQLCSRQSPNPIVLPPLTPDAPAIVYLLTPQPTPTSFPLGGHFRIEVAADGNTANLRSFANSCVTMPSPATQIGKPILFFITHLLDPVPTEIHVFTSLASHVTLAVGTISNGAIWAVDGADIRFIQALPNK